MCLMKRLVIGTLNKHKGRELMEMLVGLPVKIELLSAFKSVKPVPENGATLRENARLKAMGFARQVVEIEDKRQEDKRQEAGNGKHETRRQEYRRQENRKPETRPPDVWRARNSKLARQTYGGQETNPKSNLSAAAEIQNPKFETPDIFVLADDSGLEVDALDGAPGVRSARYAGESATYPQLIAKLLDELKNVPAEKRTARFRCCVCMASASGVELEAEGACEGRIIFEARGSGGFGYDPVFVPEGYDKTFAELGSDVKNKLSHRGAAIRAFRKKFAEYLKQDSIGE